MLKTRPAGLPAPGDFELSDAPIEAPLAGQVLVRNRYILISPSVRQMVVEGAQAMKGVPHPVVQVGGVIFGAALGDVMVAPPRGSIAVGDLVIHHFGWSDYATGAPEDFQRVPDDGADAIAHLGHGWTAYAALARGVSVRPGDTAFISSAAGAIGSMAGQIARLLGCRRVIGSTSSDAKARVLKAALGYDAVITRHGGAILDQLRAAAPEGIDVFVDSVGGDQFEAGLAMARPDARVAVIGTLSGQLDRLGIPSTMPVRIDNREILSRRLTIRGYSADADPDLRPEWERRFAAWARAGQIVFPHTLIRGLENAPSALEAACEGGYVGAVIVEV